MTGMATTVNDDGQVTLPKPVLEQLGIGPGSEIAFRRAADGSIVIERARPPLRPSQFAELRGHAGPGLSTDEIMALTRGD